MPIELVDLLLSRLDLVGCIRLSSMCKAWNSLPLDSMHYDKTWPLLMQYSKHSTTCRFYDPLYCQTYSCEIKALKSCEKIWSSNNGFIVMSRSYKSTCILNPSTGVVVNLPLINVLLEYTLCDAMMISSNREVAAIYTGVPTVIFTWRPGMNYWDITKIMVDNPFWVGRFSAVFVNRRLYFIGGLGDLQILDLTTKTSEHVRGEEQYGYQDAYLFEYQGKVFRVYENSEDGEESPVYVHRLDETTSGVHVWTEMKDLGDLTLFLNRQGSMAVESPLERCANRILLSAFHVDEDDSEHLSSWASYCMKDQVYDPKFYGKQEPISCIWVKPNLKL